MTLIEGSRRADLPTAKEPEYRRTGVIVVLAHMDVRHGQVSVCMLRHTANPLKGIQYGDLGLPSETLETSKNETPGDTLARCFVEELGIVDPLSMGFYRTSPESQFEHRFNLDTGLNGDSSNALGHGVVIWTPSQGSIIRSFQMGTTAGLVDRTELNGIGFHPLERILDENTDLAFRKAPNPRTIVSQLHANGMFKHP